MRRARSAIFARNEYCGRVKSQKGYTLSTRKSAGELKSLPRPAQKRIIDKMRFYAAQKNPLKFAKRLVDRKEGEYRFRAGDYRIIFDVSDDKIFILKIDKRDKIYN